jgi:RNA polymerase sigma-70 factor (ECF subfamily)
MSHEEEVWRQQLQGLRDGDPEVVPVFWEQYGEMLHGLADKHLWGDLRRRVGPEDVVQSVCRTFFRRAKGGEFRLRNADDLWRLLCVITLNKVRDLGRFHRCQKRGLGQEVELPGESGDGTLGDPAPAAPGPSAEDLAAFADQLELLVASLDEEEQQVVDLKLQDCTNHEVADRLRCSTRTVRRILKRVQTRLVRVFEVP